MASKRKKKYFLPTKRQEVQCYHILEHQLNEEVIEGRYLKCILTVRRPKKKSEFMARNIVIEFEFASKNAEFNEIPVLKIMNDLRVLLEFVQQRIGKNYVLFEICSYSILFKKFFSGSL